jgi:hypothetical protein
MDNADNVEGFMAEKAGVARPSSSSSSSGSSADQLLRGLPYRISSSASASKEQLLVQVGAANALFWLCLAAWLDSVLVTVLVVRGLPANALSPVTIHLASMCAQTVELGKYTWLSACWKSGPLVCLYGH